MKPHQSPSFLKVEKAPARPDVPVAQPYVPPPAARSHGWLVGAGVVLVLAVGVGFVGALMLPDPGQPGKNKPTAPPVAATVAQAPAAESAQQEVMASDEPAGKEADIPDYKGVSVPDKLDSYVVAGVDPQSPSKPLTRPAEAPVVVPQLPAGGGPMDLAVAIDKEIASKLAEAKIPASPLADDAEFLRRAYLDITGRIPTYDQAVAFLNSKDPYKRSKLIDELVSSESYGRHFAAVWADLLIKRDFDNNKNLKPEKFVDWLAERFNKSEGWDKIVTAMMTAEGKESDNPAIFFFLANQDNNQPAPEKLVGATGNLFMGIQVQCAQCHVHPFTDKWKPTDFWGMAAFFGHTRAEHEGADKKGKGGIANIAEVESVKEMKKGKKDKIAAIPSGASIDIPDPTNPKKSLGNVKAKFFEGTAPKLADKGPYRPALATWVVSDQNRYFAPALANRMWAHFFARGFVNPIDDMKLENKASHPAALQLLAKQFADYNYDVKFLVRAICNTQAYQRTSRPLPENKDDEALFSHMPVKVLSAEVFLEAVALATSRQEKDKGDQPKGGGKKNQGGGTSLTRFFDTREYDDDPRDYAYGIPQILRLMNTNLSNGSAEMVTRLAKAGSKPKVIEDIYLTVLARRPSADEVKRMTQYVNQQGESKGYQGVFWALLNSAEFACNR